MNSKYEDKWLKGNKNKDCGTQISLNDQWGIYSESLLPENTYMRQNSLNMCNLQGTKVFEYLLA